MNILADIQRDIDSWLARTSDDPDERFLIEDRLATLQLLKALVECWIDETLDTVQVLTNTRIELEIAQALRMKQTRNPEFWQKKHDNMKLLQSLVTAWREQRLGGLEFEITARE